MRQLFSFCRTWGFGSTAKIEEEELSKYYNNTVLNLTPEV